VAIVLLAEARVGELTRKETGAKGRRSDLVPEGSKVETRTEKLAANNLTRKDAAECGKTVGNASRRTTEQSPRNFT
jgi:hypothetical protein